MEFRHMALQGLGVWWEEKEMHINQAGGTPKGQLSDTGQCGGSSAWVGMVGFGEAGSWKIS